MHLCNTFFMFRTSATRLTQQKQKIRNAKIMEITATYRNQSKPIILEKIEDCTLTEWQASKAEEFGATHVFKTDDVMQLPKYVQKAFQDAGMVYTKIGHTSYSSATWGAKRA